MTRYAVAMGSNLGDRLNHLVGAGREMADRLGNPVLSGIYETEPVGGPDHQDPFLNAVALVETDLGPLDVLDVLQDIENSHNRDRKVRWGPRTLDLDIVATDGPPVTSDRLTVPHPRAAEREFVLRPLNDVWPEAPVGGSLDASSALAGVGDQGVDRLSMEWMPPVSRAKANALLAGQFTLIIGVALALAYDGTLPEGDVSLVRVAGGAIAFLGAILAFIASRRLGTSMTASPIPKPEAVLVVAGPYRYARHPIYGGLSLFMMGTALVLDSLVGFAFAALLVPYFMFKAGFEENQLRMRFAGYLAYKQVVPRRLIPFVV